MRSLRPEWLSVSSSLPPRLAHCPVRSDPGSCFDSSEAREMPASARPSRSPTPSLREEVQRESDTLQYRGDTREISAGSQSDESETLGEQQRRYRELSQGEVVPSAPARGRGRLHRKCYFLEGVAGECLREVASQQWGQHVSLARETRERNQTGTRRRSAASWRGPLRPSLALPNRPLLRSPPSVARSRLRRR